MKVLRHPRSLAPTLALGLAGATLAVLGPVAPASAAWTPPPGCTISGGSHVTCTYNKPAGAANHNVTVPNGTSSISLTALGQRGGSAVSGGAVGGRADVVTGVLSVSGGQVITVSFADDGGPGNNGAGAGGDSARVSRSGTFLAVAAGGGGGGNLGSSFGGSAPGGAGGDAGANGANGVDLAGFGNGPQGGRAATTAAPGAGGAGDFCFSGPGSAGTSTGFGGAGGSAYGGGGGGGIRGGGGGGGGGFDGFGGDCSSGAGGGGGASLVPTGGSRRLATSLETTSLVRLEFDLHSIAQVNPSSLTFGNVVVGQASSFQTVTLTNTADGQLTPGFSSLTGPFQANDNCVNVSVPSGGSCTIQVRFAPTTTGAASGTLTIPSNALNGARTVALSGTGVAPAISTPSSLAFGDQAVGTTSAPKNLVITNTGTAPLTVSSTAVVAGQTTDYAVGNACVTTIAPNSSCTATVTFRPGASGARPATLRITSNAPSGPRDIALSGNGLATTAVLFRGPGSYYTTAEEAKATIALDPGMTAQYFVKVTNTGTSASAYNFVLGQSGNSSNAQVNIKGGAILPLDANGNWSTPVILPGKYREFAVKVKPNGTAQSISNVLVSLRHPNGALASRSFTETNTDAPLKGTDGFGLFARAGSQKWVGGSFDGQTTTNASLALNQTATFTTRLRNDGTTARSMVYSVLGSPNACWTRVVKVGTVDVTGAATGAGYVTKTLNPGQYLDVKVFVKRVATTGCSGIQFTAQSKDGSVVKHFSHLLANPKA